MAHGHEAINLSNNTYTYVLVTLSASMKLAIIFWLTFTMNILKQVISSRYYSGSPHGYPDGNSDGQQCTCTCSNDNPISHSNMEYPNIHQNSGSSYHHSSHNSHSSYKYTKHVKKIHKILKNIQKTVANVNRQSIGHNVGFRSGSIRQSGVGG